MNSFMTTGISHWKHKQFADLHSLIYSCSFGSRFCSTLC